MISVAVEVNLKLCVVVYVTALAISIEIFELVGRVWGIGVFNEVFP